MDKAADRINDRRTRSQQAPLRPASYSVMVGGNAFVLGAKDPPARPKSYAYTSRGTMRPSRSLITHIGAYASTEPGPAKTLIRRIYRLALTRAPGVLNVTPFQIPHARAFSKMICDRWVFRNIPFARPFAPHGHTRPCCLLSDIAPIIFCFRIRFPKCPTNNPTFNARTGVTTF